MEARVIFSSFVILCMTSLPVRSAYYSETEPAVRGQEKVTHLRFFLHDILSGQNPTAVVVARANITHTDGLSFGDVVAIDDVLTAGPHRNSPVVGDAKGLYVISSGDQNKFTVTLYVDLGFTTGEFNGSSISVFSRNPVTETEREVAVVGGRGKFKMARGFAKIKTSYINYKNGDAILEYNVTVFHY